jgi:hypothetical protein
LRRWLNSDFYNNLPAYIRSRIVEVVNQNNAGSATQDKVFLLSVEEARAYFKSDSDRVAKYQGTGSWWWLRSRGSYGAHDAANVGNDGGVSGSGFIVGYDDYGVRPALWLNL